MAIKKYFSTADNTITNAFQEGMVTRGTGSNMGQGDILEVFSIYGQSGLTPKTSELSRILIQFPTTTMATDRTNGTIPASGSVNFYLNLYNAEHRQTTPRSYALTVNAISSSWEEGYGVDMQTYEDLTHDRIGSNWIQARASASVSDDGKWASEGGDIYTDTSSSFEQSFDTGLENISLDITTLVEQWINSGGNVLGSKSNYGLLIKLSSSYEASSSANPTGAQISYYTKKFFSRSSEFFLKRPTIEARWDSSERDNRGNFYYSSSLAPAEDNLNSLYMYNYIRGNLQDIAGQSTSLPTLKLYYSSGSVPEGSARGFLNSSNTAVTSLEASRQSKGVYKATLAATSSITTTTYPYLVDVWTTGGVEVHTGSAISPKKFSFSNANPDKRYVVSVPNMKQKYYKSQTERFRLFVREKNWSPNIYTKAVSSPENILIQSASYKLIRTADDQIVINYGTASTKHTMMSYDVSGNYFDLDMSMLEPGYIYGLKFSFYEDAISSFIEQPYIFKFRVEEDES
tara:strand:+ start:2064 stop:3608 length:1545 start_codon:yes stop_codon:yes gene_type:complete